MYIIGTSDANIKSKHLVDQLPLNELRFITQTLHK